VKITPEDMKAIRDVWFQWESPKHMDFTAEHRDLALASHLIDIYDRGYNAGHQDALGRPHNACPFDFAHTRHWCGYDGCRDS
jgi:ribosome modulation factor